MCMLRKCELVCACRLLTNAKIFAERDEAISGCRTGSPPFLQTADVCVVDPAYLDPGSTEVSACVSRAVCILNGIRSNHEPSGFPHPASWILYSSTDDLNSNFHFFFVCRSYSCKRRENRRYERGEHSSSSGRFHSSSAIVRLLLPSRFY